VLKAWSDGIRAVLADPAYQKEYLREGLVPALMANDEAATFTAGFAVEVARSLRELGVIK
jgi:tripartite-type tricarboxylate transporter receptor subunit TctC